MAQATVSYYRTNAAELNDVPIEDGQIVVSTASSSANIYFDVDDTRLPLNSSGANDGVLTIQENGTDVATFSANQSGNSTANITVPKTLSELDEDSTHRVVTDTEKANWNAKTSNTGTVTSVTAGSGLSGGTITGSGTISANLKSTSQSTLTAAAKGSTSGREYAVGLDANGNLSVNVPWEAGSSDAMTKSGSNATSPLRFNVSSYNEGPGTCASNFNTHAEGTSTSASGTSAHSEGEGTLAAGWGSHAEGYETYAGDYAHSEGQQTCASGMGSHAEGSNLDTYAAPVASNFASHAEGVGTISMSTASHAEGIRTCASGSFGPHSEGVLTTASGNASHAEGHTSLADGQGSHSEGYQTCAKGDSSHAEGSYSKAFGVSAHAEGTSSCASANYSHAEGASSIATGYASHAEGSSTNASANYSHSEGCQTSASGRYSHAEGNSTNASGNYSHAEGSESIASSGSHAQGFSTSALGQGSHAEGTTTLANGLYSHAEGNDTIAVGSNSHAEGLKSVAFGDYSHAEGSPANDATATMSGSVTLEDLGSGTIRGTLSLSSGTGLTAGQSYIFPITVSNVSYRMLVTAVNSTIFLVDYDGNYANSGGTYPVTATLTTSVYFAPSVAYGEASHVEGQSCVSDGSRSHAEGYATCAGGANSHAEGLTTRAGGANSHAEGHATCASGVNSHAEGLQTCSASTASHAEGWLTCAAGLYSHAECNQAMATGNYSHAEGFSGQATSTGAHAEGYGTRASGSYSHAEGYSTLAAGANSHAEGYYASANGSASHAEGYYTSAPANYSHVGGAYSNVGTSYEFVHGYYLTSSMTSSVTNRLTGFRTTTGYTGKPQTFLMLDSGYNNAVYGSRFDIGRRDDNDTAGSMGLDTYGNLYTTGMRFKTRGIIDGVLKANSSHKIYIPKGAAYLLTYTSYLNTTGAYRGAGTCVLYTNGGGSSTTALAAPKAIAVGANGTVGISNTLGADTSGPGGYSNGTYTGYIIIGSCTSVCRVQYSIVPLLTPMSTFATAFS